MQILSLLPPLLFHRLTTLSWNTWLSSAFYTWFNPNPILLLLLNPSLRLCLTLFLSSLALVLLHSCSHFSGPVEVENSSEVRIRTGFDLLQAVSGVKEHEWRQSPYKLHAILIFHSYSLKIRSEVYITNSYTLSHIQMHCYSWRQNRFIHPKGNHLPPWGCIVFSVLSLVVSCWAKKILLILALLSNSKSAIRAYNAVKS